MATPYLFSRVLFLVVLKGESGSATLARKVLRSEQAILRFAYSAGR